MELSEMEHVDDVSIMWCAEELIPEVQSFIATHWRSGHPLAKDEGFLRWQFPLKGDSGNLSILIALHSGRIVGIFGVTPIDFCVRGQYWKGAWTSMWMTDPDYRAQRVGLRLLRQTLNGEFDMVGTLEGNAITMRVLRALGFKIVDRFPRWINIKSPDLISTMMSANRNSDLAEGWSGLVPEKGDPIPLPYGIRMVDWDDMTADRWDQTWSKCFAPRLVCGSRDAKYLKWRYMDHPFFRYMVRFAERKSTGQIIGLLVYRTETVKGFRVKIVRIMEFVAEAEGAQALLSDIHRITSDQNIAMADFYCTSDKFPGVINEVGFVPEQSMNLAVPNMFQPLNGNPTNLNGAFWLNPDIYKGDYSEFESNDFYSTRADCDADRPRWAVNRRKVAGIESSGY